MGCFATHTPRQEGDKAPMPTPQPGPHSHGDAGSLPPPLPVRGSYHEDPPIYRDVSVPPNQEKGLSPRQGRKRSKKAQNKMREKGSSASSKEGDGVVVGEKGR